MAGAQVLFRIVTFKGQRDVERLARSDEYLVWTVNRLADFAYARWPHRSIGILSAETRFPRDPRVLLNSVEFESLVYERGVAAVALLADFQRMAERRRRIEDLLTRELAGRSD